MNFPAACLHGSMDGTDHCRYFDLGRLRSKCHCYQVTAN
jgi:hypothetical protein